MLNIIVLYTDVLIFIYTQNLGIQNCKTFAFVPSTVNVHLEIIDLVAIVSFNNDH